MDKHPITLEEERKVWTIHRSVNGLTYYYNRATKKSQYEMPQCFKTTEETLEHPEWKQYKNGDGKKFYYNAVTHKSVWHLPNEVKQWRIKMQEARKLQKQREKDTENDQLLNVTDQQKRKFISLLKDKSVNVNVKWDACIKLCEEDDRWKVLKTSEKKKIYQDYLEELRKQLDNQKKAKLQIHKTNFLKMLTQHKQLTSDCKMHKIVNDFVPDPRWRALQDIQRENVYQAYMDELWNKEKQQAKIKKKQYCEALRKAMEDRNLSHRTKWQDFKQQFANNEYFKGLHNVDRLTKFTEYILEQEKKYQQEQHRQKQLKQKKNRQNFRELLLKKMKSGSINHKSRWVKFVKENKDERILLDMMDPNQQGSTAHQLFEQLMQGIRQYHKSFKSQIRQHFKQSGFRMSVDTSQQTFQQKLKDLDAFWTLKPAIRDYFYFYFKSKIKSKNKEGKKSRKEKKIIFKILKHIKELRPKSQLSQHLSFILSELKSYQLELPIGEQLISKYFNQYVSELDDRKKKVESNSDSQSSEDMKEKKKKKKRRRSNSSESDAKPVKKQKKEEKTSEKKKEDNRDSKEPKQLKQLKETKQVKSKPVIDQQEGQIKDDEMEEKYRSPVKSHKKKKRRSSSDS